MRLLFVTGRAHLPQSFGGVQSSTDATIALLQRMGHEGAVACALWGKGKVAWQSRLRMRLSGKPYARSKVNGYAVYRAWQPVQNVRAIAKHFAADVAVVQHQDTVPFARALQAAGIPVLVYLRNLEYEELSGDLRELSPKTRYIANSLFTAAAYRERFGIDPIFLPPLVEPERYRTAGTGRTVTMINPVAVKGGEIALRVAERCPDIPFAFVEGWGLADDIRRQIDAVNAKTGNITILPATDDMKQVYANARIVLAPSQWEEAWGRIASEAHVSGIPVVGSNRGGLPEAIGPGGIVVPADADPDRWAEAIRSLWDDEARYQTVSDAARNYAERPIMQPRRQAETLIELARDAMRDAS